MLLRFKLFFCLYFFLLQSLAAQEFHSSSRFLIPWSPEKKLTWKDFKGRNLNPFQHFSATCEAQIMVIPYYESGKLNFNIVSYFDQLKSWSKDTTNMLLLKHEQLHFDITELYARKIRQSLQTVLAKGEVQEIEIYNLINKLFAERDQYNAKMDEATDYGTSRENQAQWERKVNAELEELKTFQLP